jgi:hypothetical protein
MKTKNAIYLTGLLLLAKSGGGVAEIRSILGPKSNSRTWYRIISDLRSLSSTLPSNLVRSWVRQIDTELDHYKPLKIEELYNTNNQVAM